MLHCNTQRPSISAGGRASISVEPLVVSGTGQLDAAPHHAAPGSIPFDFGLPSAAVLRVIGRANQWPARLLPELRLDRTARHPDAILCARARPHRSGLPVLRPHPALLRAPDTRPGRARTNTLTLAAPHQGRMVGWAERILQHPGWFTPSLAARARRLLPHFAASRIGGTWWAPAPPAVSGQTIVFAAADPVITHRMLNAALADTGAAGTVLVVRRPGSWLPHCRRLGITVITGPVDPWPLLDHAAQIHAEGNDEIALLAALLGRPVHRPTPGPLDHTTDPARLLAAALLLGSRYTDPFDGRAIPCEAFLDRAAPWRRHSAANAAIACCVGISFWKRRRIAVMLGNGAPAFRKTAPAAIAAAARRGGGIAVWPSRAPAGLDALAAAAQVPVSRVEDGFIRSIGLGADFLPPLSIVLDGAGIYYDATRPSDLETLLSQAGFPPALLHQASTLRARMVAAKVTKYNLPPGPPLELPRGHRLILVPGQVADDRSVLLGGAGIRPGLDLLRRVRAAAPGAHIIYKPHPDVDAGHRAGALPDTEVLLHADQVLRGGSIAELLARVDEIHTLTSLTGFEALLRAKPVTTYGQPFYAGWGLTTDTNPPARRTRRLTLDQLVAGTLILYPRYIDPVTLLPCDPEIVLDRLADPALNRVSLLVMLRRLQGRILVMGQRAAHRQAQQAPAPATTPQVRKDSVR